MGNALKVCFAVQSGPRSFFRKDATRRTSRANSTTLFSIHCDRTRAGAHPESSSGARKIFQKWLGLPRQPFCTRPSRLYAKSLEWRRGIRSERGQTQRKIKIKIKKKVDPLQRYVSAIREAQEGPFVPDLFWPLVQRQMLTVMVCPRGSEGWRRGMKRGTTSTFLRCVSMD